MNRSARAAMALASLYVDVEHLATLDAFLTNHPQITGFKVGGPPAAWGRGGPPDLRVVETTDDTDPKTLGHDLLDDLCEVRNQVGEEWLAGSPLGPEVPAFYLPWRSHAAANGEYLTPADVRRLLDERTALLDRVGLADALEGSGLDAMWADAAPQDATLTVTHDHYRATAAALGLTYFE